MRVVQEEMCKGLFKKGSKGGLWRIWYWRVQGLRLWEFFGTEATSAQTDLKIMFSK